MNNGGQHGLIAGFWLPVLAARTESYLGITFIIGANTIWIARIETTTELLLSGLVVGATILLLILWVYDKTGSVRTVPRWLTSSEPNDSEPSPPLHEPIEYLTDEELVMRVIQENNGQVRQREIVEETGWSKSKVSRLLSQMEEEGRIQKLSLGRENLIMAPGDAKGVQNQ